jgi:hypothetical protein
MHTHTHTRILVVIVLPVVKLLAEEAVLGVTTIASSDEFVAAVALNTPGR